LADDRPDDFNNGLLNSTGTPLADILASRSLDVVTAAGWQAINTHELTAGATAGRPRQKLVRIEDMLQVAATTR
jgi:ferredoxin--NADP+ reductase